MTECEPELVAKVAKWCKRGAGFASKGEAEFAAAEYKTAVEHLIKLGDAAEDSLTLADAKLHLYRTHTLSSIHMHSLSSFKATKAAGSNTEASFDMFPGVTNEAERLRFVRDVLRIRLMHLDKTSLRVAEARHWLAWELLFNNRNEEALEQADLACNTRKVRLGVDHRATIAATVAKAFAFAGAGRFYDAGALLEKLEPAIKDSFGANSAEHAAVKLGTAHCAARSGVDNGCMLRARLDSICRLEPTFKVEGARDTTDLGRSALVHFLARYARSGKMDWALQV